METVDVVDDVIDWEGVVVVYSCWSKAEIKIIVVLQTQNIIKNNNNMNTLKSFIDYLVENQLSLQVNSQW